MWDCQVNHRMCDLMRDTSKEKIVASKKCSAFLLVISISDWDSKLCARRSISLMASRKVNVLHGRIGDLLENYSSLFAEVECLECLGKEPCSGV
jgi:hypothetical protein